MEERQMPSIIGNLYHAANHDLLTISFRSNAPRTA